MEPAHISDAHAVVPYLDQTEKRGVSPSQLLADSLYGSDSNTEEALKRGVELVAPVMGSAPSSDEITLADFTLTENDVVTACPAGHAPQQRKESGDRLVSVFSVELCAVCPKKASCPVEDGKRGRYLRRKMLRTCSQSSLFVSAFFHAAWKNQQLICCTWSTRKASIINM